MTIFYLDPVGGNDANAGTSFATRWQSIGLGATAARIAPGDTIRIIESPAPVSMGINGTFTQNVSSTTTPTTNSNLITLSESVSSDIDTCETAWTASTNVTATTSATAVQGSYGAQIAIAAAFTTGKAAFHTITQKDYTGYTRVNFSIIQSAGTLAVAGDYSIAFCSDASGNTPIFSIPVPVMKNNNWISVVYDYSDTLPATINSIALIVNVDRGAVTFFVDNFYACLPASDPKALTNQSLISRNINGTEWWIPVKSITNGVTVLPNSPSWAWSEDTQTVALWSRIPLFQQLIESSATGTTYSVVNDSGTLGNPITFSGGWNSTDMSTQTGDTLWSGVWGNGYGIYNQMPYINVDHLSFMRFNVGVTVRSWPNYTIDGLNFNVDGCVYNQSYGLEIYTQSYVIQNSTFTFGSINGNINVGVKADAGSQLFLKNTLSISNLNRNGNAGITIGNCYASTIVIDSIIENYTSNFSISGSRNLLTINNCYNGSRQNSSGYNNLTLSGLSDSKVSLGTINSQYRTAVKTIDAISTNNNLISIDVLKARDDGNGSSAGLNLSGSVNNLITINSYAGFTLNNKVVIDNHGCKNVIRGISTNFSLGGGRSTIPNFGGSSTDHRTYDRAGLIQSDTTVVHTEGTNAISWKLISNSASSAINHLELTLASAFTSAGTPITFKCFIRRSSTSENCGLKVIGGRVDGITTDVVSTCSAAINTWEEVTITVTPTSGSVIEVMAFSYGNAGSVWFDDVSIS